MRADYHPARPGSRSDRVRRTLRRVNGESAVAVHHGLDAIRSARGVVGDGDPAPRGARGDQFVGDDGDVDGAAEAWHAGVSGVALMGHKVVEEHAGQRAET